MRPAKRPELAATGAALISFDIFSPFPGLWTGLSILRVVILTECVEQNEILGPRGQVAKDAIMDTTRFLDAYFSQAHA